MLLLEIWLIKLWYNYVIEYYLGIKYYNIDLYFLIWKNIYNIVKREKV